MKTTLKQNVIDTNVKLFVFQEERLRLQMSILINLQLSFILLCWSIWRMRKNNESCKNGLHKKIAFYSLPISRRFTLLCKLRKELIYLRSRLKINIIVYYWLLLLYYTVNRFRDLKVFKMSIFSMFKFNF